MSEGSVAALDTNVLLNLATPVVDGRDGAPSGDDPLRAVLCSYDVHVPETVLAEITDATGSDDLLSAAADAVLRARRHPTTYPVDDADGVLDHGPDAGEAQGIRLANEIGADLFVTDEFSTTNYLLVSVALDDRETLYTTPHVLCVLGDRGVLPLAYVDSVLTYLCDLRHWDEAYVDALRDEYR
jgi:hypothetical protein